MKNKEIFDVKKENIINWCKEDWVDFYKTLRAFLRRVEKRYKQRSSQDCKEAVE